MPSSSPAQARLMAMIAHGGKPTGMKSPPSPMVAREFNQADAKTGILRKKKKKEK